MNQLSGKTIKRIGAIALTLFLFFVAQQIFRPESASAQLDTRISRLESEVTVLRSTVNRLETAISRVSRPAGTNASQQVPDRTPPRLSSDPMFDRLATLAIEQRERIDALEQRIAVLETRLPTQPRS